MKYLIYRRLQKIEKYLKEYDYKINKKLDFPSFYDSFYLRPVFYITVLPHSHLIYNGYTILYSYGCILLRRYGIDLVVFKIFEDKFITYSGYTIVNRDHTVHSYLEIEL
jgi:hypothetical protein